MAKTGKTGVREQRQKDPEKQRTRVNEVSQRPARHKPVSALRVALDIDHTAAAREAVLVRRLEHAEAPVVHVEHELLFLDLPRVRRVHLVASVIARVLSELRRRECDGVGARVRHCLRRRAHNHARRGCGVSSKRSSAGPSGKRPSPRGRSGALAAMAKSVSPRVAAPHPRAHVAPHPERAETAAATSAISEMTEPPSTTVALGLHPVGEMIPATLRAIYTERSGGWRTSRRRALVGRRRSVRDSPPRPAVRDMRRPRSGSDTRRALR